jgi:hypothetical protein
MAAKAQNAAPHPGGCPAAVPAASGVKPPGGQRRPPVPPARCPSGRSQIKLAPVNAPYFQAHDMLIAADCTAYAYGAFHEDFIRGRVTLIGCPKLDEGDLRGKAHRHPA